MPTGQGPSSSNAARARQTRWLGRTTLAYRPLLLLLPAAACSHELAHSPHEASAAALTAEQCNYFEVGGRVQICHATNSTTHPFTILRVSESACVSAHANHSGDYIAVDDPSCRGGGCLPEDGPCDSTLPCCDGLSCVQGVCTDAGPACVSPPSNMIGWWDGDAVTADAAIDLTGSNDGILVNGTTTVPGKVGQAFEFDGVDDYIAFGDIFDGLNTGLTLDAWFKTDATVGNKPIVAKYWSDGGSWLIRTDEDDPSKLNFTICDDTCHTFENLAMAHSTSTVNDGEWHHVAGTFDGTTASLYLDGALQGSDVAVSAGWADTHHFCIGAACTPSGEAHLPFAGSIDEIEIFDRALSAAEIQAIFDAGSAGKCK